MNKFPKEHRMFNQEVSNADIQKLTKILMSGRMNNLEWLHSFVSQCPAYDISMFLRHADKADIDIAAKTAENITMVPAPHEGDNEFDIAKLHIDSEWLDIAKMFSDCTLGSITDQISIIKAIREKKNYGLAEARAIFDHIMYDVYGYGEIPRLALPDGAEYLSLRNTVNNIS